MAPATATAAPPAETQVTCTCGCGRSFRYGKMFGNVCVVQLRALQIRAEQNPPKPAPPPPPPVVEAPKAARYVYICSPFRAETEAGRMFNIVSAKAMCQLAVREGFIPIAPHLFYPEFLDDDKPEEREMGIAAGLVFLQHVRELWYLDHGTSEGMKRELAEALLRGIPCRPVQLLRTGERDWEPVLMDQVGRPS